ncbi:MAG TPA: hypothetical protein VHG08_14795 [Longimicrobium sp.]|nr:hypothetical protein [Longimicrobium sp.]
MATSLFPRLHRAAKVLVCAASLAACGDQPSNPQPLDPGDIRTFVTAEVAAQLARDGHFPLRDPDPEPYPQISREQAAEIALAWARTYGKFFRPYLERDHGRRIDFDALTLVSPVWYAGAVYEPVPPDAHPGYRNAFGPHYILYLGSGGDPVLGVSVAAFAQSSVTPQGLLSHPDHSGNEVIAYGVPPGWGFSMPVSAEQAVRIAGASSGARAAETPELINPHQDYHPYHARWKVSLDRPVTVRGRSDGGIRSTRVIYVGAHGELLVPAAVQPDEGRQLPLENGGRSGLRRRVERPVLFQAVNVIRQ